MNFDKPKDQWDELDKQDREYMDLVRKLKTVDLNTFLMYLQTDKDLHQTLSSLFQGQGRFR
jgi:hypothetical protein